MIFELTYIKQIEIEVFKYDTVCIYYHNSLKNNIRFCKVNSKCKSHTLFLIVLVLK